MTKHGMGMEGLEFRITTLKKNIPKTKYSPTTIIATRKWLRELNGLSFEPYFSRMYLHIEASTKCST